MCIRVQYAPLQSLTPWDPRRRIVTLPDALATSSTRAQRALRAVLAELAIPQPPIGARCFCGEPVRLLPDVPQQRRSTEVMTHHGA